VDLIKYILEGHHDSFLIGNTLNPKNIKEKRPVPEECLQMKKVILKYLRESIKSDLKIYFKKFS
jgi:hypothetical protein